MPDPSRREFLLTASLLASAANGIDLAPPDKQPPNLQLPKPPGKRVGFAIVGLGNLALGEILPAFKDTEHCIPVALVSGHADKAKAVAEHYGIDPKAIYGYENYDSIKDNPAVEVIYIVLPNSMHAEYTIRGFKAGKHVLCEKPMADTVQECEQMIAAGKEANKKLMIAYRLRYEPFNRRMIDMCRKKQYGELRVISSNNTQNVRPPNIRLSKSLGGGPIGDVGVYCINACRYLTGEEPTEVFAMQQTPKNDPRFAEVPATVMFNLRFPTGVLAHCCCGFDETACRDFRVIAKDGYFGLDPAFDYHGIRGYVMSNKGREEIRAPDINQFAAEMDHMAQCALENKEPLTPGEEGLADIKVIAKIDESLAAAKPVQM